MRLHRVNRLGEVEIEHQTFGTTIVGKRYVQIDISPEEIVDYVDEELSDSGMALGWLMSYVKSLTKHYKKND